ncbi:DNA cytosine methyltransferase [Clostridium sp. BNL1100]|uniref:DNA cytosine methyltransferase n=1 Tax=Clostridium sp. BNL1100 TaxID=755731 RepID=UPI00024A7D33|nr:DNA cytosine methyltransferase [Clostridium sp. BNL1100]AEY67532.1 DNA-methyltransferase Dcm [Clostridium sp. BNL1100]
MRSIEICAGAGGQALGLEQAGYKHVVLVEIDQAACATLRTNRPKWNVLEGDVREFKAKKYKSIDLVAGGVPCPPFSVAGKQLGNEDDRDLFPEALRIVSECDPKAVMLENVRGLFDPKFSDYRNHIKEQLESMGYKCFWELVQANHYGVPQLRPRTILVALKQKYADYFTWPLGVLAPPPTVGQALYHEMASNGWEGAKEWADRANNIAPTIVGGSKKHGGADLGPTRSKLAWSKLGINGHGLDEIPPAKDFTGDPKLTVKMASLLQGFPPEWVFVGKKTPAYRQVGNAFPPPVAKAVGTAIKKAILQGDKQINLEGSTNEKSRSTR